MNGKILKIVLSIIIGLLSLAVIVLGTLSELNIYKGKEIIILSIVYLAIVIVLLIYKGRNKDK